MSKRAEVTTSQKVVGIGCLSVVIIILAIVLIAAFSGDKSSSPNGSTPSNPGGGNPSATSGISANDPAIKQAAYLATLRMGGIRGSDQTLIQAGHATCSALDAGNSMPQVLIIASTAGSLTPEQGGRLVGGAVFTWCPKYQPEIDKLAGN